MLPTKVDPSEVEEPLPMEIRYRGQTYILESTFEEEVSIRAQSVASHEECEARRQRQNIRLERIVHEAQARAAQAEDRANQLAERLEAISRAAPLEENIQVGDPPYGAIDPLLINPVRLEWEDIRRRRPEDPLLSCEVCRRRVLSVDTTGLCRQCRGTHPAEPKPSEPPVRSAMERLRDDE